MFYIILLLCIFNYNVVESNYDELAESHRYSILLQNLLNKNMPITPIKELDKGCTNTCNDMIVYNCDMYSYYINILDEIISNKKSVIINSQHLLDLIIINYNGLTNKYNYPKLLTSIKNEYDTLLLAIFIIKIISLVGLFISILGTISSVYGCNNCSGELVEFRPIHKNIFCGGLIALIIGSIILLAMLILYILIDELIIEYGNLLGLMSQYQ